MFNIHRRQPEMCGIVAASSANNIVQVLIVGLKKPEYRGYDSAGIAVIIQLAVLFPLTLVMDKVKKKLAPECESARLDQLRHLPVAVNKVLQLEPEIKLWVQRFADKLHVFFLGLDRHYPITREGALKLKKISYNHAEAYTTGELKHGPLALPVIAVAPQRPVTRRAEIEPQGSLGAGRELYVFADSHSEIQKFEGVRSCTCSSTTVSCRRRCTWCRCNYSTAMSPWSRRGECG